MLEEPHPALMSKWITKRAAMGGRSLPEAVVPCVVVARSSRREEVPSVAIFLVVVVVVLYCRRNLG